MQVSAGVLAAFIIYILIIAVIAYVASKKTNDLSDYVLGGRRLSPFVAAMGAGASDMSGWLLLGLPGAAYAAGFSQSWIAIGLCVGAFLNWTLVAKRLRIITEKMHAETIPEYFRKRFEDHKDVLAIASGIVTLIFFTVYAAAEFKSNALLAQTVLHYDYIPALIVGTLLVVVYVFVGGFLAVSWADTFQTVLMFGALVIIPVFSMAHVGGFQATLALDQYIKGAGFTSMATGLTTVGIVSLLAWGLGYFGQTHILVRFMAIKNPNKMHIARNWCIAWMIITLLGALLVGFSGLAYAHRTQQVVSDPESIFFLLAKDLFPSFIAGFLLAAVLSAVMSSTSAKLVVCSSVVAHDFYAKLFPAASESVKIWLGRATIFLVSLCGFLIALNPKSSILTVVSYAWSGMGSTFGPLILVSLFWKGVTKRGAIASFFVGAVVVVGWELGSYLQVSPLFNLYSIIPGFFSAVAAIVFVSLLDPHKLSQETLSLMKAMEQELSTSKAFTLQPMVPQSYFGRFSYRFFDD